ncbi:MAG: ribosome biogenesis GTP-binding protein YihA/YsxC [Bacteroidales bacterium]|nr:ribosome biogenesis GTP-binding protein YihA/YsxC [Bacteroidales bacterium]
MKINTAIFIKSSPDYKQCPDGALPEYAFIGRSNVGKSSLINMLTGRKGLAKISGTPGKTQLINHFLINDEWHLVDLPGYGFAKISKKIRENWEQMIFDYLSNREQLVNTFILIDSRHEPLKPDLELIFWFGEHQKPFTLVFTKADKLSKPKLTRNLNIYRNVLQKDWEEIPVSIVTSAKNKLGRDDLLNMTGELNEFVGR